jgi:hypothetical protein
MNTLLVVLPILPDSLRLVRDTPELKASVDYAGGLKGLAEYCFHCQNDWDLYVVGIGEQLFSTLDATDIDPRKEQYNRETIEKVVLSDYFMMFLRNFFDQHNALYNQLVGSASPTIFVDHEPVQIKRSDAIAILLSR